MAKNAIIDTLSLYRANLNDTQVFSSHCDLHTDVPKTARKLGIGCRSVMLEPDWWRNNYGHLVGMFRHSGKDGAEISCPVVLKSERSGYFFLQPGERTLRKVTAELAGFFEPHAFEITPPFPKKIGNVFDLLRFLSPIIRSDFFSAMRATFVIGLFSILIPIATGFAIDDLIPSGDGIALLAAAIVSFSFTHVRQLALLRMEGRTKHVLQCALWDRILKLPAGFFKDFSSGDLQNRIEGVNEFRNALINAALSLVLSVIFAFFYLGLLVFYSPLLAAISVFLIFGFLLATFIAGIRQIKHNVKRLKISGWLAGFIFQLLQGIVKLRSTKSESRGFAIWSEKFIQERVEIVAMRKISYRFSAFAEFYAVISLVVIFAALIKLSGTQISPGSFIAFLAAFAGLQTALLGLSGAILELVAVLPQWRRAQCLFTARLERPTRGIDPGSLSGAIELTAVTFGYNPAVPVVKNVSFSIQPGKHLAIVGPSGSGKSTLFRILLGFEIPQQGTVVYDGKDLTELDIAAVRRQIGVVTQNGSLFAGSILDNIRGAGDATHSQCMQACNAAGLGEDISSFPMGIMTPLTEGATTLSGGQRQRILIARALVKNPRILLLDEATSALDNVTQKRVTENLGKLGVTRITIAHRLSTVMLADEILVMKGGSIVGQGTYKSLLRAKGLFAELANRQLN